ncbi:hypothetical protein AB4Z30_07870 [Paenibacillus sp. 2TAF8]|jgi:hypothetical protein|uniref:hypothetical protein n=1 Tax=Paenibacillus sp. 2TAF8 TaxID=3233020 RepID=UPI003F9E6B34
MSAKRGHTFNRHSGETKKEVVRLRVEKGGRTVGSRRNLGLKARARLSHGFVKARMERVLRITMDVGRRSISVVQKKKMLI